MNRFNRRMNGISDLVYSGMSEYRSINHVLTCIYFLPLTRGIVKRRQITYGCISVPQNMVVYNKIFLNFEFWICNGPRMSLGNSGKSRMDSLESLLSSSCVASKATWVWYPYFAWLYTKVCYWLITRPDKKSIICLASYLNVTKSDEFNWLIPWLDVCDWWYHISSANGIFF